MEEIKDMGVKVASKDEAFLLNVRRGLEHENKNIQNQIKSIRLSLKKTDREIIKNIRQSMKDDIKQSQRNIELNNLFIETLNIKLAQF